MGGVNDLKQSPELSAKAKRFQVVLDQYAPESRVVEFDKPSRTAQQAADAIGCELDQIVKSLVFRAGDDRPVLVLTAGGNRVDEGVISEQVGAAVGMADAAFVRAHTGYAIGAAIRASRAGGDPDRRRPARVRRDLGRRGHTQHGLPDQARPPPGDHRRAQHARRLIGVAAPAMLADGRETRLRAG